MENRRGEGSLKKKHVGLVVGCIAVVVILVAAAILVPLYQVGRFAPSQHSIQANFQRLCLAMETAYPYFETKEIDWAELSGRYAPQVASVTKDGDYYRIVARMLAEMQDGHTGLLSPSVMSGRYTFATCIDFDGTLVVDQASVVAVAAGLQRGDVVLAVGDLPIAAALKALPPMLVAGSSEGQRRSKAARVVLGTTGESLSVVVRGIDGERKLHFDRPGSPLTGTPAPIPNLGPRITGRLLPSGIGVITIPDFEGGNGYDLVAEFDAVLHTMMDAPAIIVDVRGNGGGSTLISDRIAGRFLSSTFTYGREYYTKRLVLRFWSAWYDYRVKPRGMTYQGKVVILTDVRCVSTTENFIVALVDSGRAHTVGQRTGGSSGNPMRFMLTGGAFVRFSAGAFHRLDGTPLEGQGIAADIEVAWTVDDIRSGRDPDLKTAEKSLLCGLGSSN
jgi:carboxyl-terminal processing protease